MLPNNYQESLICIEQACQIAGLSFKYLDEHEVLAQVTYPNQERLFFTHNKNPFNNFTSAKICEDKAFQADLYSQNEIPHPKTKSYFNPQAPKAFQKYKTHQNTEEISADILQNFQYPFFLKKNSSSLSKDVHLISSQEELSLLLEKYFSSDTNILIAQEQIIGPEYRVISWKGDPLLAYEKGSKFSNSKIFPQKIDAQLFTDLTQKIYKSLNINFFGADIIQTQNGEILLETNANPACFYYNKYNGREDFTQVYLKCLQEYQS